MATRGKGSVDEPCRPPRQVLTNPQGQDDEREPAVGYPTEPSGRRPLDALELNSPTCEFTYFRLRRMGNRLAHLSANRQPPLDLLRSYARPTRL